MTQIIYRIILLWAVGGPLMAVYLMINHRENLAHDPVTMPEWIPFWPLLAIPYLGMLIVPGCLSLFIKEQRDFYQYLVSITIAFLVVGSIWYFYPTEMIRPPIPGDWQSHVYREMVSVDNPVCIVPCGHVITPIAVFCILVRQNSRWLFWLIPLLVLGIISIVVTWQHRPVDVIYGTLISFFAVVLTRRLFEKAAQG